MATPTKTKGPEPPAKLIKQAHWRILIRPGEFAEQRIPTTQDCLVAVDQCKVALRGWDYPWIEQPTLKRGSDFVSSSIDWDRHLEFWTMWQSGQFLHYLAFWEDYAPYRHEADKRLSSRIRDVPQQFTPSGYVEPTGIVYTVTEIYEFARRLATRVDFGAEIVVEISLQGTNDRVLMSTDSNRWWTNFYRATTDTLDVPQIRLGLTDFIASYRERAIETALWIFDKFGWNPPREVLAADQERLYSRQF